MASLVINTGVETHPQISIDGIDLKNGLVTFHWVGGPYSGDCAEDFPISLSEHGSATISQMVDAITAAMISKLA